ncbi:Y-family DNA polymerase [Mucilaginibacter ginkgonis]|uniref:DNA polymerase Y family protein n=1 Tax=Mucilaginibacter ginkgonis TaxID=2682091 RepID=A0A6I4HY04_9SPHI|nr:DNA polymerase Y family protein [Mucilaginibacter ginkgonis]QQL51251.1 DNA polymerase Y family protein [Mucilaginibacter ginkgonis]
MAQRFVVIWFHHLLTDWLILKKPGMREVPFIFTAAEHNRIIVIAANQEAESQGIFKGIFAADAKAIVPDLQVFDHKPGRDASLLKTMAEWCIRFSPIVAVDRDNHSLIFDITGCAHLLGSEEAYMNKIANSLHFKGFRIRAAMADTIGAAWAVAHFGKNGTIVPSDEQANALLQLPANALRLQPDNLERLIKLGLKTIGSFIKMPRSVLRRRFGDDILLRIGQAIGFEEEVLQPVKVISPYEERLPCLEPICTASGIEIAIEMLLAKICRRLENEGKGLRIAILTCYRVDGNQQQVQIGTNTPSNNVAHLLKLFTLKIDSIEPALGIELFILEAPKVENINPSQEVFWGETTGLEDPQVAELLDRIAGKFGAGHIRRYLPQQHYWPERSVKSTTSIKEQPAIAWSVAKPRPTQLLPYPQRIEVAAPIPDYPPINFRYKDKVHHIRRSDGPERIEREWWMDKGEHRDYYVVEDEAGCRYWLFRLGHYSADQTHQWFIHGFFA